MHPFVPELRDRAHDVSNGDTPGLRMKPSCASLGLPWKCLPWDVSTAFCAVLDTLRAFPNVRAIRRRQQGVPCFRLVRTP